MKNSLFLIFALFICTVSRAQQTDTTFRGGFIDFGRESKDLGLLVGVHQGHSTFFELGISRTKSKGGCAFGSYFKGRSVSASYNPFQNKTSFAITTWTSLMSMITIGADVHTYTDFTNYNLGLKPFIGIGPGNFAIVYGYNFELVNHGMNGLNRHCVSVRFHLSLVETR